MSLRLQRLFAWCGPLSIVAFAIGWVGFAGFLPPLAPSHSAQQIAHTFIDHRTGIRFGALIMIMGTALWIPFAAAVAARAGDPDRRAPILAWTQVAAAAAATAIIIVAMLIWVVAAFRVSRDPAIIQTLSDLGFVISIMPFMIFVVWNAALGIAIFCDERDEPAYPRWAAYFCMWTALLYLPGGVLAFFQTGPFAWNGLFAFFVPATAFFVWLIGMTLLTVQSINRELAVSAPAPAAALNVA
jgi:hypothetical protein